MWVIRVNLLFHTTSYMCMCTFTRIYADCSVYWKHWLFSLVPVFPPLDFILARKSFETLSFNWTLTKDTFLGSQLCFSLWQNARDKTQLEKSWSLCRWSGEDLWWIWICLLQTFWTKGTLTAPPEAEHCGKKCQFLTWISPGMCQLGPDKALTEIMLLSYSGDQWSWDALEMGL